jgi:hypothetical protein
MAASSAGARRASRFLRLPEPAAENGKEITRSAPAERCPHGDDGWGEFVRSADPAADQRQGRPKDCTAPSFSSHHEAARRRPRREARAPCGIVNRSAEGSQHAVIRRSLTRAAIEKRTFDHEVYGMIKDVIIALRSGGKGRSTTHQTFKSHDLPTSGRCDRTCGAGAMPPGDHRR